MNTPSRHSIRSLALSALCAALPAAGTAVRAQLAPNIQRRAADRERVLSGLWTGCAREQGV